MQVCRAAPCSSKKRPTRTHVRQYSDAEDDNHADHQILHQLGHLLLIHLLCRKQPKQNLASSVPAGCCATGVFRHQATACLGQLPCASALSVFVHHGRLLLTCSGPDTPSGPSCWLEGFAAELLSCLTGIAGTLPAGNISLRRTGAGMTQVAGLPYCRSDGSPEVATAGSSARPYGFTKTRRPASKANCGLDSASACACRRLSSGAMGSGDTAG